MYIWLTQSLKMVKLLDKGEIYSATWGLAHFSELVLSYLQSLLHIQWGPTRTVLFLGNVKIAQ